jgi:hypothetical protein
MYSMTTLRELAYRAGDGVEVSLFWSPADGSLKVVVDDHRVEERLELDARPDNALEVFYHPYAYASTSVCALAA